MPGATETDAPNQRIRHEFVQVSSVPALLKCLIGSVLVALYAESEYRPL